MPYRPVASHRQQGPTRGWGAAASAGTCTRRGRNRDSRRWRNVPLVRPHSWRVRWIAADSRIEFAEAEANAHEGFELRDAIRRLPAPQHPDLLLVASIRSEPKPLVKRFGRISSNHIESEWFVGGPGSILQHADQIRSDFLVAGAVNEMELIEV